MQANLYYKEGSSDKVYHATLEKDGSGYVVNFAYGRRGNTLQTGTKTSTPTSLENATKVFNKIVNEKMAKGYRPVEGDMGTIPVAKELPDTPTTLQCALLNPIDEEQAERLLDDDLWAAQPKFDGVRFMLVKKNNQITALNRKGKQTSVPNSLAKGLDKMQDFLIDGELIGEKYHAFDILELDGKCLRDQPLKKRIEILGKLLEDGHERISLTNTHTGKQKRKLYNQLQADEQEGIVFKRLDAKYNAGRPASGGNYLKHKFYATCSCIVAEVNQKRSVALELTDGNKKVPVGNVTIPNNFDTPKKGEVVEVRYLYAYKGGSLYQPIYLGPREDIEHEECRMEQLKYKPE